MDRTICTRSRETATVQLLSAPAIDPIAVGRENRSAPARTFLSIAPPSRTAVSVPSGARDAGRPGCSSAGWWGAARPRTGGGTGLAPAGPAAGDEFGWPWQGVALNNRAEPLAKEIAALQLGHCDVTEPATIDAAFAMLKDKWGKIDFVVHAIAFSDKDELDGAISRPPRRISPRPC